MAQVWALLHTAWLCVRMYQSSVDSLRAVAASVCHASQLQA